MNCLFAAKKEFAPHHKINFYFLALFPLLSYFPPVRVRQQSQDLIKRGSNIVESVLLDRGIKDWQPVAPSPKRPKADRQIGAAGMGLKYTL